MCISMCGAGGREKCVISYDPRERKELKVNCSTGKNSLKGNITEHTPLFLCFLAILCI